MKPLLTAVLLCALAPQESRDSMAGQELRYRVSAERLEGEVWCSISAETAPLRDVMGELAARTGLAVEGFERISRTALVTVDLRHRPLREALDYVLGSVSLAADLRTDTIHLREADGPTTDVQELREEALLGYLRALRDFPDHPLAAEAAFNQAGIEVSRGNASTARIRYESLVERYPSSRVAPEALMRAGELLRDAGEWTLAAQRFAELLRIEEPHGFESAARFELARATEQLGDHERALFMLDALDALGPPSDRDERQARLYLRARALLGLGRPRPAVDALDRGDLLPRDGARRLESFELRALALEALEQPALASRAWLVYAAETPDGPAKSAALERAALLSSEAGEDLGTLFIAAHAAREGLALDGELVRLIREARARLQLDGAATSRNTELERLARGERLVQSGQAADAYATLGTLAGSALLAERGPRLRWILSYARAMAGELGLEAAVAFLRDELPVLEAQDDRRRVYLLAAELFEGADRMDEAIEAYRGRL